MSGISSKVNSINSVIYSRQLSRYCLDSYLDALDPHDEPAHVAGDLAGDGEGDDGGVGVGAGAGHQRHAEQQRQGRHHHAHAVHPPSAVPIWTQADMY